MESERFTELHTDSVAVGGDAVARDSDGRVVFVTGALAHEKVRVQIRSQRRRHAFADVVEVLEPAPDRREPICVHAREGCRGCGWAFVDPEAQRRAKVEMVRESLQRLGKIADPVVEGGPELAGTGFRTTVRAAVVGGRAGYRRSRSHDHLTVDSCRVAHDLLEPLIVQGQFGSATEVVLRSGARTGDRLVLVDPSSDGVVVPDDVVVIGADKLASGVRAWIHEEVAGIRFRISAASFFQARPDGAEALVESVSEAVSPAGDGASMADLYCGVGLFAATVGQGRKLVAVERSASSLADARVNLAGFDAKLIKVAVERWRPSSVEVVVADPPRSGLAKEGVAKVGATGASHLALVSCDAASLGRDAGLLREQGWKLQWSRLVDMFPDTAHVEVVSSFVR